VELTPRTAPDPSTTPPLPRRRSVWAYVVLAVVLVGVGVVAYQGLTSASLYFYNADEAVELRGEHTKRIRVQGTVQEDVRDRPGGGVAFTISFNGVDMAVEHDGDPPELFEPGIPVVLEGHWASSGESFLSDEILVKHDEQYEAENEDRLDDAEDGRSGDAEP
jgi:cytochrome c-type biogenesis protein CcmE